MYDYTAVINVFQKFVIVNRAGKVKLHSARMRLLQHTGGSKILCHSF